MDIRQLRYFVAVARVENFNLAAAHLHIAQPALSRQIKALENELGIVLFERLPRGVRLTPAGQAFADRARRILIEVQAAQSFARSAGSGEAGQLRLGLSSLAVKNAQVMETLRRFCDGRGGVQLTVSTMASPEQLQRLHSNELDVGIVTISPKPPPGLKFVEIAPYRMKLALNRRHPLARRARLRMADLIDEDFLWTVRQSSPWAHDLLITACLEKGFSPRIVQEVDNYDLLLALVSLGVGMAFVHPLHQPVRNVAMREIEDLSLEFPLYLACRHGERAPAVTTFMEVARQVLAEER